MPHKEAAGQQTLLTLSKAVHQLEEVQWAEEVSIRIKEGVGEKVM